MPDTRRRGAFHTAYCDSFANPRPYIDRDSHSDRDTASNRYPVTHIDTDACASRGPRRDPVH